VNRCNAPLHNESGLTCGKCGETICPECAVPTPVGFRCRECANLYKLPTFRIEPKHYVIAVLVGLGLAVLFGLLWSIAIRFMPYLYLNLVIAPGIGAAISEVMSRAVNRKRGLGLAIIAGGSMVICYLIEVLAPWGIGFYFFDIVGTTIGVLTAASLLR